MTFTELTAISQLTSGSAEGVASFALGLDDTSVALNITTILIVIGGITYLVFMALPSNPAGCVLSSCYRPVWREFSFRKSGRF